MMASVIMTQPNGVMQIGDKKPVHFHGTEVGISIVESIEQSDIDGYSRYTVCIIADSDFVSDIIKDRRTSMEVVRK